MSRVSTRTLALASSVAALSMTLSALETHGVTTKDPTAPARKASKKH